MLIHEKLKQREHYTNIECSIADYVLQQEEGLEHQSARSIANQLYMAPSTVVRFFQKLGFQGFNDFKSAYLEEVKYLSSHFQELNPNTPFQYHDKNIVVANKMGQLYHEIIDDTLSLMHHDNLQKAINMLNYAKTIYICSAGVQNEIAYTFKDKLLKIGKDVVIEDKLDEAFYRATYCQQNDVFIIISYSGETENILKIARKLHQRHIRFLAITSYGGNALTKLTDDVLYVSTREKLVNNLGNFSMNLATLLLLDILYMNMFNTDFHKHFESKVNVSHEYEQDRKSHNPIIKD
ncbi:MurR/RpiR family transcriptional regulator [Candidatus Stoquefichus massiliensis]|uniref:MurR/RpiR family transcriptional regulator n=1 Tax=Candidatus Stoquefichus massiliensis TaxID=1470350 RepID=UPI000489A807|nr:MurR/RpiR family transcriptional regulator [Candidatus Stoquefichus massiliensis]